MCLFLCHFAAQMRELEEINEEMSKVRPCQPTLVADAVQYWHVVC